MILQVQGDVAFTRMHLELPASEISLYVPNDVRDKEEKLQFVGLQMNAQQLEVEIGL